jgi:MFS superfamily sulfate permease-like transporter
MNNDEEKQWPLFRSFQGVGLSAFRFDLVAGLTLAAIAIPTQMATARLGGFAPDIGFFAFIAGTTAFAAFGSNRFLSAAADSTIMPIFAGSLALLAPVGLADYSELAATLALLVGLILVLAGVFRAGWVADLLSIPVVTGFLAGIAIHIAVSQAPSLLGLPGGEGEVFHRLALISHDIGKTNFLTLAIGASCLACIVLCEIISPRIPGALIALAGATFVVAHFDLEARRVAVIGAVKFAPPHPSIPMPSLGDLTQVIGLAAIISVIVMVQTAATSRSFPGAPGEAPDVDRDYIGVGAGSALAGLFGAFPVDASPPSTAIVAEVGARSQLAGLVACAIVAAVAVYGAELLAHVPEAALAGVLLYVAARIFRLPDMLDIGGKSKAEFALVVVTMLGVVILPVQIGVALAIMLSLIHGVWMMTRTRLIEFDRLSGTSVWWPLEAGLAGERLFGVLVVAFQAPLSFLNAYQFQHDMREAIARADGGLRLVVLEASSVVEIDFTAARILGDVIAQCRARGVDFAIVRLESVRAQAALESFGVMATLGQDRLFHSVDEATRKLAPEAAVTEAT